jgi:hypothetical protein
VGMERGSLSLLSSIQELLERKSSGFVIEAENTAVGIRHADQVTSSVCKKLAPTSSTSDGLSVGIVHSRTQATELCT